MPIDISKTHAALSKPLRRDLRELIRKYVLKEQWEGYGVEIVAALRRQSVQE